jgi:hypothetical protein
MPGYTRPASAKLWGTKLPTADRAKLVHLLKERAWDLAAHKVYPGHA